MNRRDCLRFMALMMAQPTLFNTLGCAVPVRVSNDTPGTKGNVFLFEKKPGAEFCTLKAFNWDSHQSTDHPLPLNLPHSLLRDINNPNELYVFEIMGSCVKIHLSEGVIARENHRQTKVMFMGHAIQSKNGEALFCTQMDPGLSRMVVAIKSSKTLKTLDYAPDECRDSHHITILPGTTTAACGNSKNGPNGAGIAFFDYEKNKFLSRIGLDETIIHVYPVSHDEVVGIGIGIKNQSLKLSYDKSSLDYLPEINEQSNYYPVPLYYTKLDGSKRAFWTESQKELFSFNFSLANVNGTGRFVTSHVNSNSVMVWKDFKVEKVFSTPYPTNIAVSRDGKEFMVASGGTVKIFSLETLEEIKTAPIDYIIGLTA